jgi:hypothetical protein
VKPITENARSRRGARLRSAVSLALGALVLVVVLFAWRRAGRKTDSHSGGSQAADDAVSVRAPLPSLGLGPSSPTPLPTVAPPEQTSEQIASILKSWHAAIVTKNAETVESLDRVFAEQPDRFVGPLMENAEGDSEERVRSFSTRVLGKLRRPESLEVLRRLLKDPSQYVRFNAAWALGELSDREAAATLLHLERRDPSPMVRQSAGASRRKIEGS